MPEGLLLVNKPADVTSHDVVQAARRKLGIRRIGHTGTLDPMAEGLLILLVGRATQHQQAFQTHEKLYEAEVRFGTQTDTGDATGQPIKTAPVLVLERTRVEAVLKRFEGPLSQTPPAYSAVKVQGRPAYWWARRNQPVVLAARIVHLFELTLVQLGSDTIVFRVRCSAGTYVRTLAESIAEQLGTVGHLTKLVRLRIGRWSLEDSQSLAWLIDATPEALSHQLQPIPSTAQ